MRGQDEAVLCQRWVKHSLRFDIAPPACITSSASHIAATPEAGGDSYLSIWRIVSSLIALTIYPVSPELSANFSVHRSACIASILRLRVLYVSTVSKDLTWDKAPTVTWSAIELSMGIFCACIPTLRPLACHLFPKAFKPQRCARVSAGYRKEFPTARMKAKAEPEDITLTSYVEVSSTKDNAPVDPESAPVAGDSITQASEGSVTIYE